MVFQLPTMNFQVLSPLVTVQGATNPPSIHGNGHGCHDSKYWKVDVKGPIVDSIRLNNFGYHVGTAFLVEQILY